MQLAEVNVARLRFPADSPQARAFVAAVDPVNLLAERAPGFERIETPATALWWVSAGHEPTTDEALERLAYLRTHGPTAQAFTVRSRFTPDGRREVRSGPRGRTRRPASPFS